MIPNTSAIKRPLQFNIPRGVLIVAVAMITTFCSAQNKLDVTYLYNSGWVVESEKWILIFDYVPLGNEFSALLNAKIVQAQQQEKNMYVLITHEHQDHFNKEIFNWRKIYPDIRYVFGWPFPNKGKDDITLYGRDSVVFDGVKIFSHPSTDLGSGFLISIGDITIYHAGDHALWTTGIKSKFTDELQYIKSKTQRVQLAFVPVARGKLDGCKTDEVMLVGAFQTLQILNASYTFPMHMGCGDFNAYKQFSDYAAARNGKFKILTQDGFRQSFELLLN